MSLITVDKNKCKRDGICADECPFGLIEIIDKDSFPAPVKGAAEFCINCGHCVAVCPHGAISLKTMTPEECRPIRNELLLNNKQVEQFLNSRRSIRTYKDKPVDKQTLERLIDVARYAPTGRNMQPVRWLVIYDNDEVKRLEGTAVEWMRYMIKEQEQFASMMNLQHIVRLWDSDKITPITCGAPHMIVAYASKDLITSQEACIIAMTYIDIAAPSFGLGSCWAGYFNAAAKFWPSIQKSLRLPDGFVPFCSMMIGYPEYRYQRIPVRNKSQIVWR
jgi:nitroreductase/NAD-dependent dihydropyrimidine dehydrogenase PreA subunit